MGRLNKYQKIVVLHVVLVFVFVALADLDGFIDHESKSFESFGIVIPMELWAVFVFNLMLLALVIISWRGATEASSQTLKNYFRTFRWVGPFWLAYNFGILVLYVWAQFHIQSLFKSVPK